LSAIFVDGQLPEKVINSARERLGADYAVTNFWEMPIGGVPIYSVNHGSDECARLVQDLNLDFLVNAGTPKILKENLLKSCKGVINCHPGILPSYRGCSCVEWSLHFGDPVGATAHIMREKIDVGPVLALSEMPIAGLSYNEIRKNMLDHQASVLKSALERLLEYRGDLNRATLFEVNEGTYHKPMPNKTLHDLIRRLDA